MKPRSLFFIVSILMYGVLHAHPAASYVKLTYEPATYGWYQEFATHNGIRTPSEIFFNSAVIFDLQIIIPTINSLEFGNHTYSDPQITINAYTMFHINSPGYDNFIKHQWKVEPGASVMIELLPELSPSIVFDISTSLIVDADATESLRNANIHQRLTNTWIEYYIDAMPGWPEGYTYPLDVNYYAQDNGRWTIASVVPEPTPWALLGIGLALVALKRRPLRASHATIKVA